MIIKDISDEEFNLISNEKLLTGVYANMDIACFVALYNYPCSFTFYLSENSFIDEIKSSMKIYNLETKNIQRCFIFTHSYTGASRQIYDWELSYYLREN